MMVKKSALIILTICFFSFNTQATVVVGDSNAASGDTFSFTVSHAKVAKTESEFTRLWLASGQTITDEDSKKFALSFVQQISAEPLALTTTGELIVPKAVPMANSEDASIYTESGGTVSSATTTNPIFGAEFKFFDMLGNKPTFVVAGSLNDVFHVKNIERYEVPTAEKTNITELLKHDLGTGEETAALLTTRDSIFVAHATGGPFGANPSKITKLFPSSLSQNGATVPFLQKFADESVAVTTEALKGGGGDLADLGSNVTFHNFFNTLYSGLEATAAKGDKAAGAMSVKSTGTDLMFDKIANDAVISDTVNTAVSAKSSAKIRITKIAGMDTSTFLHYLIVARDDGTGPQSIYAVPLVSKPGDTFGQVADATSVVDTFNPDPTSFLSRTFDTPLTTPTQISIEPASEQIEVGKGAIPLTAAKTDIKDMYTVGDSVYVVIGDAYATGIQPGTFCSQAIFAQNGSIMSWTPWTRALGSDEPMIFSQPDNVTTSAFFVSDSATTGTTFKKVVQTQWNVNANMSEFINSSNNPPGGTQGLFNFPVSSTGFDNVSFLIATGFNSVTIGQTGHKPGGGEFRIKTMAPTDVVAFNNNIKNGNTALVAAEIAHNGANHWLFAGGASGVFVLTGDANGYTHTTDFTAVANFSSGQTWKEVGDFSFVKKLVWDKTFLYILTTTTLYRISLDPTKFTSSPAALNTEIILEASSLHQQPFLLDLIIDDDFCILGTTNGMYSFTASTSGAANLVNIPIPDGLQAVSQLFAVSNNAEPQRKFKDKSNLYVLNNTFGSQQARLNRFTISSSTITPFNDALFSNTANPNGIATSFIKFNQFISNYFTNGTWNLASNYFLGTTQPEGTLSPSILQIFAGVKNGRSSSHIIFTVQSAYVSTLFLKNADNFLGIQRESTSGALIATGNLHARVNA